MCGPAGCNHDHEPTPFEQYAQRIAEAVRTTQDSSGQQLNAASVATGIVELDLDMADPVALQAYEQIIHTQQFAQNLLIGALQMRAGTEPGGCAEITVDEHMRTTFCEGIASLVEHFIATPAA